jgi:DNA-binding transcriptional regulator YiaG
MHDWGVVFISASPHAVVGFGTADDTFARAAALAREQPFVASTLPEIPELTGNLVTDARSLAGLTTQQLADLCGVTERTMFAWRDHEGRISTDAEKTLRGLRAISAALVGALGPSGVARWLLAGPEAPFEELKAGRVDDVVARAQQYLDSPAT